MECLRTALLLCVFGIISAKPTVPKEKVEKVVNDALNTAVHFFSQELQNFNVGDFNGATKDVKYGVTENVVKTFTQGTIKLGFGSTVSMALDGFGIQAAGNWYYAYEKGFIKIRDRGTYSTGFSGLKFSVAVKTDINENLKVSLKQTSCSANLDTLNLKLEGGASWIYNLFLGKLTQDVRVLIGTELCKELGKQIQIQSDKIKPITL